VVRVVPFVLAFSKHLRYSASITDVVARLQLADQAAAVKDAELAEVRGIF
jgi:hypothetical protein